MAKRRFRSRGRFTRLRRRRRGGNKRTKRFIKAVVRRMCETKYAVKANSATPDSVSGYETVLTPNFPQGVNRNERIGNRIRYKYFQFRMSLYLYVVQPVTSPNQIIRVIIWSPKQEYNVVVNPSNNDQLFYNPGVGAFLSSINPSGAKIYMDRTWYFARYAAGMSPIGLPISRVFKKKFRLRNEVNFMDSTQLTPTNPKDQIYLTVVTNGSTLGQTQMGISFNCRFSFIDM